jgi:hypothetical protein
MVVVRDRLAYPMASPGGAHRSSPIPSISPSYVPSIVEEGPAVISSFGLPLATPSVPPPVGAIP